jgi:hypothetical protein
MSGTSSSGTCQRRMLLVLFEPTRSCELGYRSRTAWITILAINVLWVMKRVVQFSQSRSQKRENDQRNDEDPHVERPIVAPADLLETSL